MVGLRNKVEFSGCGIHSGLPVHMVVNPSDTPGIYFRRTDMSKVELISGRFDNVGETRMRNTTVGNPNGVHVQTIEHLMAALFIAGIDSAVIDIDGPETPILDGSAAVFFNSFANAGAKFDGHLRKIIVRRPVTVYATEIIRQLPFRARVKLWFFNKISGRKTDGFVRLDPIDTDKLEITATLVYPEKIIGCQTYTYAFDGTDASVTDFVKNISRARTFGKYSEWEYLKAHGMGRGANENNVIALNNEGDGTLNETIWPDEFVRHKIIDALGDMFTSGGFIIGHLESFKGSHALNNLVLKKLFSDRLNYDIVYTKC